MIIDDEFENRHSNYQRKNYDYTKARYSLPAMQFYSDLRLIKFHNLLLKNTSPDSNVLDVGCGTGVLLKGLTSLNKSSNFTGLDFSNNMLENTILDKNDLERVKLIQGDAFNLPFEDESFDAVITSRFIHQYSDSLKKDLVKEMRRVLKPKGVLIIEFYCLFPRILAYIQSSIFGDDNYTNHYLNRKQVSKLLNRKYLLEPISLPGPNILVKIFNLEIFKKICISFNTPKLYFLFDQFLVISRK